MQRQRTGARQLSNEFLSHERRFALALAILTLAAVALTSSCDSLTAQPSTNRSPADLTTSGPTTAPGPGAEGSLGRAACAAFTADDVNGQNTRYDAGEGSAWWVTLGIVTNRCHGLVRVEGVAPIGPVKPGIDWLGRAVVRRLGSSNAPITAFWATRLPEGGWTSASGAQVEDRERMQVVALIRVAHLSPSKRKPRAVPKARLTFRDSTGATGQITLDPVLAFCDCQLPAGR